MDSRDSKTWATLELTTLGEIKVDDGVLEKILKKELEESIEVFIPVSSYDQNGRKVNLYLLEGYVFVQTGLDETRYFDLERTPYFETVFSTKDPETKLRVLSVVSDVEVEKMRDQLRGMSCKGLSTGDSVFIVKGAYKNLTGSIIDFEGEDAYIKIDLRSLSTIVKLPPAYLSTVKEEEL